MIGGPEFISHDSSLEFLRDFSFPVNPNIEVVESLAQVIEFCQKWQKDRHLLPYEIDGVAIKVNDLQQRETLGFTARARAGRLPLSFLLRNAQHY